MITLGAGVRVSMHGASLDPDGTYVLMANHQSHIDVVALIVGLPMVPGFLAKAELRKVPLFGKAMESGGHVFVDRSDRARAFDAISEAARDIRTGKSIVIFPEGTRSDHREVLPFKKGGFHLAQQARVPVVPIGIRGSAAILPKHSRELLPGDVHVHVGAPIDGERVASAPLDDLIAEVRGRIVELSGLPPAEAHSH
jgi:1-acyl-sn-glycerol-3-phosphate acyltransferase